MNGKLQYRIPHPVEEPVDDAGAHSSPLLRFLARREARRH